LICWASYFHLHVVGKIKWKMLVVVNGMFETRRLRHTRPETNKVSKWTIAMITLLKAASERVLSSGTRPSIWHIQRCHPDHFLWCSSKILLSNFITQFVVAGTVTRSNNSSRMDLIDVFTCSHVSKPTRLWNSRSCPDREWPKPTKLVAFPIHTPKLHDSWC
jgi:hypothetical protein